MIFPVAADQCSSSVNGGGVKSKGGEGGLHPTLRDETAKDGVPGGSGSRDGSTGNGKSNRGPSPARLTKYCELLRSE